jgi:hypothetical protein
MQLPCSKTWTWVNTMSTSEPSQISTITPDTANWAAGLRGSDTIAPGVFSPAELARMANEIFNELPDEQQHLVRYRGQGAAAS